jgi:hypothetical protein
LWQSFCFFTWGQKRFKNRREFLKGIEANLPSKGICPKGSFFKLGANFSRREELFPQKNCPLGVDRTKTRDSVRIANRKNGKPKGEGDGLGRQIGLRQRLNLVPTPLEVLRFLPKMAFYDFKNFRPKNWRL